MALFHNINVRFLIVEDVMNVKAARKWVILISTSIFLKLPHTHPPLGFPNEVVHNYCNLELELCNPIFSRSCFWWWIQKLFFHYAVTKCICTLCLCCCTLCVALSVFFRVCTSFSLLRMFYVSLFWTSLRQRQRKREGITTASLMYHQTEKKK